MTPEEQLGFAPEDLRECVGKLLCNAIEVRPQSAFAQYMHNSRADRRGDGDGGGGGATTRLVALARSLQREEDEQERASADLEGSGGDWVESAELKASDVDNFFGERTGPACTGVYALHSKLNHSCRPNVVVVSGAFYDSTIEVTAARDIAEGEELCFSYTNPKLSRVQRRRVLLANHFFHCMCPECVVPTATTPSAGPIVEATS